MASDQDQGQSATDPRSSERNPAQIPADWSLRMRGCRIEHSQQARPQKHRRQSWDYLLNGSHHPLYPHPWPGHIVLELRNIPSPGCGAQARSHRFPTCCHTPASRVENVISCFITSHWAMEICICGSGSRIHQL